MWAQGGSSGKEGNKKAVEAAETGKSKKAARKQVRVRTQKPSRRREEGSYLGLDKGVYMTFTGRAQPQAKPLLRPPVKPEATIDGAFSLKLVAL